eukprot:7050546-Pyramimonas_sp.AAC.1
MEFSPSWSFGPSVLGNACAGAGQTRLVWRRFAHGHGVPSLHMQRRCIWLKHIRCACWPMGKPGGRVCWYPGKDVHEGEP